MRRINPRFRADRIALEVAAIPVTILPEDRERARLWKLIAIGKLEGGGAVYDYANEEDFYDD